MQPDKPIQIGYIERFNRFFRENVLDSCIFYASKEVNLLREEWMEFYNEKYPHESLKNRSPREYLRTVTGKKLSIYENPEEIITSNLHNKGRPKPSPNWGATESRNFPSIYAQFMNLKGWLRGIQYP